MTKCFGVFIMYETIVVPHNDTVVSISVHFVPLDPVRILLLCFLEILLCRFIDCTV